MNNRGRSITDTQVLTQLRKRRLRLQLELERVDMAIKAFETIDFIDPLDAAVFEVEDIVIADDDLAMSVLMYNPKSSAEKKIEFALSKLGCGDAVHLAEYLLKIDGRVKNAERFTNNITFVASRMYRAGKLDAERVGKRNIYRLKESYLNKSNIIFKSI